MATYTVVLLREDDLSTFTTFVDAEHILAAICKAQAEAAVEDGHDDPDDYLVVGFFNGTHFNMA